MTVRCNVLDIRFPRVFLHVLQELQCYLIHIIGDLCRIEQCGVFQDALTGHDSITTRILQALNAVLVGGHPPIGNDRDLQALLDLSDDLPVAWPHIILVMLSRPPMHHQHAAAGLLNGMSQGQCVRLPWKAPNLTGYRYFQVFSQDLHHGDN